MNIPGFTAAESLYNAKYISKTSVTCKFDSVEKILPQRRQITNLYFDLDTGCFSADWEDPDEMVSGSHDFGCI